MKTTIEISDSLLEEAKRLAAKKAPPLEHTSSRVSGESSRNEKVAGCFDSGRRDIQGQGTSARGARCDVANESAKRFTREGADDRG